MSLTAYDRRAAVDYAHRWATGRNPRYYNYDALGGDCTNFASQCLYAGSGVMDYRPTLGWYYLDANRKAPAWTGVPYLYNYLTRTASSAGPVGRPCAREELEPGDVVQLSFDGVGFHHTPVVVAVTSRDVLVAAHSNDGDYLPLSGYSYEKLRYLHIVGVNRP